MAHKKPKIIGKHSTQKGLIKSNTIEHEAEFVNHHERERPPLRVNLKANI